MEQEIINAYKGKTVLLTGHTGFKGSWLAIWLHELGAKVIGFSLPEYDNMYVFEKTKLEEKIVDIRGDVHNLKHLQNIFEKYKPDIVFHLAAQPLVRQSYKDPMWTFSTNIMGTVNVLECIRNSPSTHAAVIITTDKCYKNKEAIKGYTEEDELGGHDPYSASKACAEIVTDAYIKSFFSKSNKFVATARAGNVIGGGDFAKDRIFSDSIKNLLAKKSIEVRSPKSIRPWQHVLEPLSGYLMLGEKMLSKDKKFIGAWNFGPAKSSLISVSEVVSLIIRYWGEGKWVDKSNPNEPFHETGYLWLVSEKAHNFLGWKSKWPVEKAIQHTVEWYKKSVEIDAYALCKKQIQEYSQQ